MTAITTSKHKVIAAKDFLENLDDTAHTVARNHYMFISRSRDWPNEPLSVPPTSDISPPAPEDAIIRGMEAREAMIALKKLTRDDSTLAIPRFNWTSNTKYAQFDDRDPELHLHPTVDDISNANTGGYIAGPIYVLTSQYNLFKCLSNNNGSISTEEPTLPGGAPWTITTSDGYVWKYMLTIPSSGIAKFLTDSWIPISTIGAPTIPNDGTNQWDVENDAVDGAIEVVHVDSIGNGYKFIQDTKTAVAGTANTITLENEAGITDQPESITGFPGCTVYIISGTGAGQSNVIQSYTTSGEVATMESAWSVIPDSSSVYEIWPTATLTGNGINAEIKVIINGSQQIDEVIIVNQGSGYRSASISLSGGLDTGGSHGSLHANISPFGGHGKDAESELDARYVMMYTKLDFNESDFPVANDYRQVGILRNVTDFGTNTLCTDTTRVAVKKLNLSSVTSGIGGIFPPDEIFTGDLSNVNGQVVDYISSTSTTGSLTFWQDGISGFGNFTVGETITSSPAASTAIIDSIEDEEVDKESGDLIYIENRRPVLRAPNQIEDIKIILEF